jgi:murein DD-endopeptidase MepM/ murein hydrolase activator NlpD
MLPPALIAAGVLGGLGLLGLLTLGQEPQPEGYHLPVPGRARVTSGYGWRTDPLTGARSLHEGIDLGVPLGTPVLAVAAGRVDLVQRAGVGPGVYNGNAVFLRTIEGRLWAYLHLHGAAVRQGQSVRAGALLGWAGSTGRSTGPHLHLQVWDVNGQTMDARRLYPPGSFA